MKAALISANPSSDFIKDIKDQLCITSVVGSELNTLTIHNYNLEEVEEVKRLRALSNSSRPNGSECTPNVSSPIYFTLHYFSILNILCSELNKNSKNLLRQDL